VNGVASTAPIFLLQFSGMNDFGRNAAQLADGIYPWRKATIKPASTVPVATDTALVIAAHPSSTLPAGSNNIGLMTPAPGISASVACLAKSVSAASNIKASAGNVYGVSVSNLVAATTYLQFFNTTAAPAAGVGVRFLAIPASATLSIPPGAIALGNFATGIGVSATTTAGGTTAPATFPAVTVFYL
jgi:hypothetical protein